MPENEAELDRLFVCLLQTLELVDGPTAAAALSAPLLSTSGGAVPAGIRLAARGAIHPGSLSRILRTRASALRACHACPAVTLLDHPAQATVPLCPGCRGVMLPLDIPGILAHQFPGPGPTESTLASDGGDPSTVLLGPSSPASVSAAEPGRGPRNQPAGSVEFGRYRLLGVLGAGGMGTVWKARDAELDRIVALKQLREPGAQEADSRRRFDREARLAAHLRHPGIVTVLDVGEVGGVPYLTMEFVEGRTFASVLDETRAAKSGGREPSPTTLRREVGILAETAEALAHAHERGVVHRDLKPANVMVDASGAARVADFGLATVLAGSDGSGTTELRVTRTGQLLGTPAYMSPELARADGTPAGAASDVWALGVMLYEVLTGTTPFASSAGIWDVLEAILNAEPAPPRRLTPGAPEDLEALCLSALAKSPADRCGSAAEFAAELRRWLAGERLRTRPAGRLTQVARGVRRHPDIVAAAVVFAALLALAVGAGWRAQQERDAREVETRERLRAAVHGFTDATRRTPLSAEARETLARQPLGLIETVLAEDPESGLALAWRARIRRVLGMSTEAEEDFDRACRASPTEPEVWWARGWDRIQRYARSRDLPRVRLDAGEVRTHPPRAETAEELRLRAGGLADLGRMFEMAGRGGRIGAEELRLARATVALYSGGTRGFEEARATLGDPDGPEGLRLLGLLFALTGRYTESVAAFDRSLASWPEDPESLRHRGLARLCAGLQEQARDRHAGEVVARAISDFSEALARDPGHREVLHLRGVAARSLGEFRAGRGQDARALFRAAIDDFEATLAILPDHLPARDQWCLARSQAAEVETPAGADPRPVLRGVIEDCERSLALSPAWFESRVVRAQAAYLLGLAESKRGGDPRPAWEVARGDCTAIRELDPECMSIFAIRGSLEYAAGAAEAAEGRDPREHFDLGDADFTRAIRRRPGDPSWRVRRGEARVEAAAIRIRQGGDPEAAFGPGLADFQAALVLDPDHVRAFLSRGRTLVRLGQALEALGRDPRAVYEQARTDLDETLRRGPDLAAARAVRGLLHLLIGQRAPDRAAAGEAFTRALADLDEALRAQPADPRTWHGRGQTRIRLLQLEIDRVRAARRWAQAARADLDRALELDPSLAAPRSLRGYVRWWQAEQNAMVGRDPGPDLDAAEQDLGVARAGGDPGAVFNLVLVLRARGRIAEALALLQSWAGTGPRHRALVEATLADTAEPEVCAARLETAAAMAEAAFARAADALAAGAPAEARRAFDEGIGAWDQAFVRVPAAHRWLQARNHPTAAAVARALVERALLRNGGSPDAPADPAGAAIDLARALDSGRLDPDAAERDPRLESLRRRLEAEAGPGTDPD